MRELNTFFQSAIEDLIYLLDRQYPKKPAITIVGNRYRLDSEDRMVLYRGVFDSGQIRERKKKLQPPAFDGRVLIDGYNVIITLESYLKGKRVFRSLDGYVRDVSGMYGNHSFTDFTMRSVDLMIQFLKSVTVMTEKQGPTHAVYLDSPVSRSGELAAHLRDAFEKEKLKGAVYVTKNPDSMIIDESRAGDSAIVASSDTVILDRIERSVDIPAYIIERVFQKKLIDLETIR